MALRTNAEPLFVDLQMRAGLYSNLLTAPTSYEVEANFDEMDLTPPEQQTIRVPGRTINTIGTSLWAGKRPSGESSQIALTTNSYTPALLALSIGATVQEVTVAATPVASQAITTVLDVWIPVFDGPIGSVVLTMTGTVDAAKYEVDVAGGFIKAIHSDAVGTGTIGYTPVARTYEEYLAGQARDTYWHLTGRARNAVTGLEGRLDIWCANLAPSAPLRVPAADEAFKASLSGDMIVPSIAIRGATRTTPYRFRDRRA